MPDLLANVVIAALTFPEFDPAALRIGPIEMLGIGQIEIRWYALAYIVGLVLGWRYCRHLAATAPGGLTPEHFDDFLVWATLGVILGGRIGFVLFYNPGHYVQNPLDVLQVWRGGMSFHGGLIGVILAILLFARRHRLPLFVFGDIISCAAPIGLLLGRLANFVNGELWGRTSDLPWAVIFPHPSAGGVPRHPSQLYEAALEGLLLLVVLYWAYRRFGFRYPGLLGAIFITGYSLSRFLVEFVRQPGFDNPFPLLGLTMGQLLCLPMMVFGVWLAVRALGAARRAQSQA